eukprot:TRINITY_DN57495_c0_g1_i1.p1 TRINITY_DN57495_c0_g1~~TRINITY_DN57495_c0_g1_i1.p1  ORF type:complete len:635 (+),score=39.88 TRINITY_DN57495_c0_g1_i1:20-1924(+)
MSDDEDEPLAPPGYYPSRTIGDGGYGHVVAAHDAGRVLQHTFQGDGSTTCFEILLPNLTPDDKREDKIWVEINGKAVADNEWDLSYAPTEQKWPLHLTFPAPPPAGSTILIQYNEIVAIKWVTNFRRDLHNAVFVLREIKIMKFFNHPNIVGLRDVHVPTMDATACNDIFVVMDLMEQNLRTIVKNKNKEITVPHASYYLWQILNGLKALHDADIIHRDLKPHNVLVNKDHTCKICDMGMARKETHREPMTEEVQTIWYRAPEVLLQCTQYSKPMDMWSIGCILAELLSRTATFPGRTTKDMLQRIIGLLGSPTALDLEALEIPAASRNFVLTTNKTPPVNWNNWCPQGNQEGKQLLSRLFVWDPQRRYTVEEALSHPFVHIWKQHACNPPADVLVHPATPQRREFQQLINTLVQLCDDPSTVNNLSVLFPAIKQLNLILPDTALLLKCRYRWNPVGLGFEYPLSAVHMQDMKYFFNSLHMRKLSVEAVPYNDTYEADFSDVDYALEARKTVECCNLLFAEVEDFHRTRNPPATSRLVPPMDDNQNPDQQQQDQQLPSRTPPSQKGSEDDPISVNTMDTGASVTTGFQLVRSDSNAVGDVVIVDVPTNLPTKLPILSAWDEDDDEDAMSTTSGV